MQKISHEAFQALPEEQQKIILSLGLEVDSPHSVTQPKMEHSVLKNYACIVETECLLCKTISKDVFLMKGSGGLLLSSPGSLNELDGMTVKTREETVLTCGACYDTLKLMEREDLIALTIKAAKGSLRCVVK